MELPTSALRMPCHAVVHPAASAMTGSGGSEVGTSWIVAPDADVLCEPRTFPSELSTHPEMSAAAGSFQAIGLPGSQVEIGLHRL